MSKNHRDAFMRGFSGSLVLALMIIVAIPKAVIGFIKLDHHHDRNGQVADNHQ